MSDEKREASGGDADHHAPGADYRLDEDAELAHAINYRLGLELSLSDVAAILHVLAHELEIRGVQELKKVVATRLKEDAPGDNEQ